MPARCEKISEVFELIKAKLVPQFPEFKSLKWRYCGQADEERRKKPSSYAHVLDKPKYICVAHKTKELKEEQIAGIFAHELGHLCIDACSEKQTETRANYLFEYFTGYKIYIDKNKIQYLQEWKKIKNKNI